MNNNSYQRILISKYNARQQADIPIPRQMYVDTHVRVECTIRYGEVCICDGKDGCNKILWVEWVEAVVLYWIGLNWFADVMLSYSYVYGGNRMRVLESIAVLYCLTVWFFVWQCVHVCMCVWVSMCL